jgi:hypothetical protein
MHRPPLITALVPCLLSAAAIGADIPPVDIHGFVSQGYLKTSENNYLGDTQHGSFAFNEVALSVQSRLADDLRVGAQLFARDLGGIGGDRVGIDWAFLDYHWRDELGLRVGQVKVARGLYNECFDLDVATPTVLLPQPVYDQRLRDFLVSTEGASLYGTLGGGRVGSLEYEGFVGTKSLDRDGSVAAFFRNAVYSSATDFQARDVSLRRMEGGSLTWNTPLRGLRLNGSYLQFDHLVVEGDLIGFAPVPVPAALSVERGRNGTVGGEYSHDRLRLAGEYTLWNLDYDIAGGTGITRWGGWYGQAAYRVSEQWEVAATYGEFYNDRTDRNGHKSASPETTFQHDAALSLRVDPLACWSVKGELHYIRGNTLMFGQDNPHGLAPSTIMLALKTTVSF